MTENQAPDPSQRDYSASRPVHDLSASKYLLYVSGMICGVTAVAGLYVALRPYVPFLRLPRDTPSATTTVQSSTPSLEERLSAASPQPQ